MTTSAQADSIEAAITSQLSSFTLHHSPPPTLVARFGDMVGEPSGGIDRPSMEDALERHQPPSLRDPHGALLTFISHLLSAEHADSEPHLVAIGYELEALVSIYPGAVKLSVTSRPSSWHPDALPPNLDLTQTPLTIPETISMAPGRSQPWTDAVFDEEWGLSSGERIRYELTVPAWDEGDVLDGVAIEDMPEVPPKMRVLVSLPPTYPNSSPPQLQLLGRYLGNFSIDAGLFGDITRTYISSHGVPFTPGDVCVFEGLTFVQQQVRKWYSTRLSEGLDGEKLREADRKQGRNGRSIADLTTPGTLTAVPGYLEQDENERPSPNRSTFSYTRQPKTGGVGNVTPDAIHNAENNLTKTGLTIISSEPIVDRKSTFVGHAIRVTDEREVPLVIHELLSDKKIAKAAHPAIFAYRIAKDVGGLAGRVFSSDYDDDGESAAGARLSHLLEILELENVLIVVSRWYGGTLLGADRFKHISQAARDALELAGFLNEKEKEKEGGKKKGKK